MIGIFQPGDSGRDVLPQFRRRQHVFVRHRLEERLQDERPQSQAEERSHFLGGQVEERPAGIVFRESGSESFEEVADRLVAVGGGLEDNGTGFSRRLFPIIGEHQGRVIGNGVDIARRGLLVVVG